ncbi:MAG: T9SS type A sorting domain-containing protein [Ignavibacteria bacterium]|nr:T9SS type A sorting domain-containing protein [Ignavibacteria bacterium]
MKKLFLLLLMLFVQLFTANRHEILSQVREHYAINSKLLTFNSTNGALINQSSINSSAVGDSSCSASTYSLKSMTCFEGVFYQAVSTNLSQSANSNLYLRKSTDGINWGPFVRIDDAPLDKSGYSGNIYVWRKNSAVNIVVSFYDNRLSNPQLRAALSTNGGASFLPSIQVSSHNDNFTLFNGGISGKGDTIMVNWVRQYAGDRCDQTWFSRTTNGGVTWSTMAEAFAGNHYSFITDITMDNQGNAWSVTADDQFARVNPVVRFTSNLGATWVTRTQIVDMPSFNVNTNTQVRFVNGKLYAVWTHSNSSIFDSVNFSVSTNGGNSWSTKKISDEDTLNYSNFSGNTLTLVHPAFTVGTGGVIYAVWPDSRERHFGSNIDSCQMNIYLTRSTDGGATWSPNMKLSGISNYPRTSNWYVNIASKTGTGTDSVVVTWSMLRNIAIINGISQIGTEIPKGYTLEQNYPNPFNPVTNIRFSIPKAGIVKLAVYDITGREVESLLSGKLNAGIYNADLNATALSSGVYFYRLVTEGYTGTKKMILVK